MVHDAGERKKEFPLLKEDESSWHSDCSDASGYKFRLNGPAAGWYLMRARRLDDQLMLMH